MAPRDLSDLSLTPERPFLCIEINPPRGVSLEAVFARYDGKLEGIDFLNVTDSALAKMRFAALPFAALLKQRYGIEPLVNFACRDRNVIAMQGDLLAAWAMGVRSIVALTGDAVTIGDNPEAKGVFELNSVGLLNLIRTLNGGLDTASNQLSGHPEYVCGVVVNPNVKNVGAELRRLTKKREAGARYALSQPVFDTDVARSFLEQAAPCEVPIMLGLVPFKAGRALLGMNEIPGIKIPESLIERAKAAPDADFSEESIELCLQLVSATRGLSAGYHVISGGTPKLALELAGKIRNLLNG